MKESGISEEYTGGISYRTLIIAAFWLFAAWWAFMAIVANLDAAPGRYALFMDELVSFDGVSRMLRSDDWETRIANVIGPDQRYGRTFWYAAAAVSIIADPFLGESGQIIATRLLFALFVFSSSLIVVVLFVRNWSLRLLALIALLSLPYSSYYATMPKPEPIIMLLIVLFLTQIRRPAENLGYFEIWRESRFILLGLAFGTKISIAPVVGLLGLFAVSYRWIVDGKTLFDSLVRAALWSIVGFLIAVPAIIMRPMTGLPGYFNQTWGSRGHGADQASINFDSWMTFFANLPFFGQGWITWPVVTLMVTLPLVLLGFNIWQDRKSEPGLSMSAQIANILRAEETVPALLIVAGLIANLMIMATTQRLWGFYLYPGSFLMIVGFWATADIWWRKSGLKLGPLARNTFASGLAVLALIASYPAIGFTADDFAKQANRSLSPAYVEKAAEYEAVLEQVARFSPAEGRRLYVYFDSHLWHPTSTSTAYFAPVYRPFVDWERAPELVFLFENRVNRALDRTVGGPNEADQAHAYDLLEAHSDHLGECTVEPCYVGQQIGQRGLFMFTRADLNAETSS